MSSAKWRPFCLSLIVLNVKEADKIYQVEGHDKRLQKLTVCSNPWAVLLHTVWPYTWE